MIHVEQHGPITVMRMARAFMGRPIAWTAAYFVDGLLIDCGPRCTSQELLRVLEGADVSQIVLTHAHEENSGGLTALKQRYPAASIYASRRAAELLADPAQLKLQRYRRLVWGTPRAVADVQPLEALDDGLNTAHYHLRVIETPGHTPDHICLFEPQQRWLFSGDAFAAGRERVWTPEADLFGVLGSLRMLADLRPERLFPAGGNVRRTPQPELHEKIGQLVSLANEVGKLESLGMNDAEIAACLFEDEPSIRRWTFGHMSTANLINACHKYNALFLADTVDHPTARGRRSWDGEGAGGSGESQSTGYSDLAR